MKINRSFFHQLAFWVVLWLVQAIIYGGGQALQFFLVKTLAIVVIQASLVYFNVLLAGRLIVLRRYVLYLVASIAAIGLCYMFLSPLREFLLSIFYPNLTTVIVDGSRFPTQKYWSILTDSSIFSIPYCISTVIMLAQATRQEPSLPVRDIDQQSTPTTDTILLKEGKTIHRIDLTKVIFIEGMKEYVCWHMGDAKLMTLHSLKNLERLLNAKGFTRIHRSYIVNAQMVESYKPGSVVVIGGHQIPIGRSFKNKVYTALLASDSIVQPVKSNARHPGVRAQ